MAFGIKREELVTWKKNVENGNIDFLTHYWLDERFPDSTTVTKVGCNDLTKLISWGKKYGLQENWIDRKEQYPHFDLFGVQQEEVLRKEGKWDQLTRFNLTKDK
ncbi:hypothetical protein CV093_10345 [Oceanobacillus sp. 143]|uniref:YneQ n=1 Tax=Oceanobacillus zhaokaii TaxID=2052660 RepID=A0A345PGS3_9BACI|nr:hypothetical protein [Oceanobacillus zhaokaii]AXI09203.1 hypothetical protein CUC15_09800 [Oceanobacillus zhaokaii]QGS68732.1 hypothetical protein CV093_10345 [Oceanobacillus sp. 143]